MWRSLSTFYLVHPSCQQRWSSFCTTRLDNTNFIGLLSGIPALRCAYRVLPTFATFSGCSTAKQTNWLGSVQPWFEQSGLPDLKSRSQPWLNSSERLILSNIIVKLTNRWCIGIWHSRHIWRIRHTMIIWFGRCWSRLDNIAHTFRFR